MKKPPIPPNSPPMKHHPRNPVAMEPRALGEPVDGERRVRFHHPVTAIVGMLGRLDQMIGVIELGHDSVNGRVTRVWCS